MNGRFPDANRANDCRRLNLLWYSALPGGIVVVMAALYAWMQTGAYSVRVIDESLGGYLPMVFGVAIVSGLGLTAFLKSRVPDLVTRSAAIEPFQRVGAATFMLLGAADAPALIGIGVYLATPTDWLALTVVLYAVAAGVLFKPDFGALLAIEKAELDSGRS